MIEQLIKLEQLGKLRAAGTLTDSEFATQKARALDTVTTSLQPSGSASYAPAPTSTRRWLLAGILLVSLLILIEAIYAWRTRSMVPTAMPLCGSDELLAKVKPLVEQGPEARASNSSVLRFMDIAERAYDASAKRRTCAAEAVLSDGPLHVAYVAEPTSGGDAYHVRRIIDPVVLPETDTRLPTRGMRVWQRDVGTEKPFIATVGVDTGWVNYVPSDYECTRTFYGPVWKWHKEAAANDRTYNYCTHDRD